MSTNAASNVTKLLPTGSYLAFQTLAPLFTNNGECGETEKIMTGILLLVFVLISWLLSFTDSITTDGGKIYYGIVTCKGLFNPHFVSCSAYFPGLDGYFYKGDSDPNKYIVTTFDFINGILVVTTFCSLSMLTAPITTCYYPNVPGTIAKCVPVLVALIVGMYFAFAPPARNGIGFAVIAGNIELVKELRLTTSLKDRAKSRSLTKGDSKDSSLSNSPSPQQSPSPRLTRSKASV